MSAKFVVTPVGVEEINSSEKDFPSQSLSICAQIISYLFHPAFIPIYVLSILLFAEPFLFVGGSIGQKILLLGQAFVNYTFFPIISILLLKALRFIPSIQLKQQRDRIIPFVICNIWYFWIWYVWRNQPEVPRLIVAFAMGIFLASSIGLLWNIYIKISMHGIAMGTAVAFLSLLTIMPISANMTMYLAAFILIAGLVGSARLILKDHVPKEYYCGFFAGAVAIALAVLIVLN